MSYSLSKRSMKELIGVHPELAFAVTEAIKITKQDFMVFDGLRTAQEQRKLVERGVSKTNDSYHLYGLAVDLVPYVNGGVTWDEQYFPEIIKAMKTIIMRHGLKVDSGFELWGWDMAHWQMSGMKPYYDIRKIQ